ncbi:MAG: branched-chain amino acid ABC transporter permease [Dehalococcoidales bacterium]|nr:branched-chain amino acid ABC transporter permease [Dehalococcoidales bacterium]
MSLDEEMDLNLALAQLPQQFVNGITLGCLYALIALGYCMVYGVLEMLNFAHGEVFMVGGYLGWAIISNLVLGVTPRTNAVLILVIMLLVAMAGAGALGVGIEWFAYRPLRGASRLAPLISALGVSIFLQNAVMLGLGTRSKTYQTMALIPRDMSVSAGDVTIAGTRILIIVVSILLMFALHFFVQRTKWGTAMRATAQDREEASYLGIDANRVISLTFLIGSMLAGAAGVLVGLYYTQVDFMMGYSAGLKGFTATVLGGIGNVQGAMLGGLVLGLVEGLGAAFISPAYKDIIAFSVLILVLLVKPSGILGENLPEKV